jgi:aspartate--ammonia ligase
MKTKILKTEESIRLVKQSFAQELCEKMNLSQISSPLMVLGDSGINDDLNGIERSLEFTVKSLRHKRAVVVNSLAKWKRLRLKQIGLSIGEGLVTDMRAIRPDEDYTPLHSIYVDQWDWEKVMDSSERSIRFLKTEVQKIYEAIKKTEQIVCEHYPEIEAVLPDKITFIHSEELRLHYPDLSPKQREKKACEEFKAVFLIGIGGNLGDGKKHDGRAPDYDDWSSQNEDGFKGLNGDILVWNPVLQDAFEISSMGIRVDPESLKKQLKIRGNQSRSQLPFHQMLLRGELPQSIGGGIGQSRLCMFLLRKKHIGEVQVSLWPEKELHSLASQGISLL